MTFTVCHGKSPFLRTVNHLFRLGPSKNHGYVSHNQMVLGVVIQSSIRCDGNYGNHNRMGKKKSLSGNGLMTFTKYGYMDVGQNGRPRGPQMWMSSLVFTIQLLGYLILTHTHMGIKSIFWPWHIDGIPRKQRLKPQFSPVQHPSLLVKSKRCLWNPTEKRISETKHLASLHIFLLTHFSYQWLCWHDWFYPAEQQSATSFSNCCNPGHNGFDDSYVTMPQLVDKHTFQQTSITK